MVSVAAPQLGFFLVIGLVWRRFIGRLGLKLVIDLVSPGVMVFRIWIELGLLLGIGN